MPTGTNRRSSATKSVPVGDGRVRGTPRRASLSQDRSRLTRRRLVRAALRLWTERGFENGIESTTVEEIAEAAGVTKGTFYFHFAHKNDILLELGWGTADALYDEAVQAAGTGRSGLAIVDQLLTSLARRAEAIPRAAVVRSVAQFYGPDLARPVPGRRNIHHGLTVALEIAKGQRELPETVDADDLGRVLAAVTMDALLRWARGEIRRLRPVLRSRAKVVIDGALGPTAL